jgi:hypothetical protein
MIEKKTETKTPDTEVTLEANVLDTTDTALVETPAIVKKAPSPRTKSNQPATSKPVISRPSRAKVTAPVLEASQANDIPENKNIETLTENTVIEVSFDNSEPKDKSKNKKKNKLNKMKEKEKEKAKKANAKEKAKAKAKKAKKAKKDKAKKAKVKAKAKEKKAKAKAKKNKKNKKNKKK